MTGSALQQAEELALLDGQVADDRVARGLGDRPRAHARGRRVHLGAVLVRRAVRVEGHHRPQAGLDRPRRNDGAGPGSRRRPARRRGSRSCCWGARPPRTAGRASIAARSPPWTGSWTGRPRHRSRPGSRRASALPAPAQTETAPRTAVSSEGSSRSSRCVVCTCMFLTSTSSITPTAVASASARPGSSVCRCALTAPAGADDEQGVAELLQLAPRARRDRPGRLRRRRRCSSGTCESS